MVVPLFRLALEVPGEVLQRGNETRLDLDARGHLHRGGEGVVGRLAHVHVIVGMDGILRADLRARGHAREVGNHLVGVHVGGSARAGLEDVDGEVFHDRIDGIAELAGLAFEALDDFIAGFGDEFRVLLR
jgi:hypothetical protein